MISLMTYKNAKTILFASLMVAMIVTMITPLAFAEESPRVQIENGTKSFDISCNVGLVHIFKITTSIPSCVKDESLDVMVERGWGTHYSPTAHDISGSTVTNTFDHWGQIIKFELQRSDILYTIPSQEDSVDIKNHTAQNFENNTMINNQMTAEQILDEQMLASYRICTTLFDKDGASFYPSFIVIGHEPFLTEKVEFDSIKPKDCEKMFYSIW